MCRDRKRQAEVDVCQRDTISGAGRGQYRAVALPAEAVEGMPGFILSLRAITLMSGAGKADRGREAG